jgi:hypothetical protein
VGLHRIKTTIQQKNTFNAKKKKYRQLTAQQQRATTLCRTFKIKIDTIVEHVRHQSYTHAQQSTTTIIDIHNFFLKNTYRPNDHAMNSPMDNSTSIDRFDRASYYPASPCLMAHSCATIKQN